MLGKHSGKRAVRQAYAELLEFDLGMEEAERVLPLLRSFVTEHKRSPQVVELAGFLVAIGYPNEGNRDRIMTEAVLTAVSKSKAWGIIGKDTDSVFDRDLGARTGSPDRQSVSAE